MNFSERYIVNKAVSRLLGEDPKTAPEVRAALQDPRVQIFLKTWVAGPLRLLAKPGREVHELRSAVEMVK